MTFLKYLLIGIFFLILQSSIIPKFIGMEIVPNMVLVYLITISIYSGYGVLPILFFYTLFGSMVDSLSIEGRVVDGIIFPILAVIINLLKQKFLMSGIFIKTVAFILINVIYILLKESYEYVCSGYLNFSEFEIYYTLSNLLVFYTLYRTREVLYGKDVKI